MNPWEKYSLLQQQLDKLIEEEEKEEQKKEVVERDYVFEWAFAILAVTALLTLILPL